MNHIDDTSSNILHVINNFNLFLNTIENKQWTRKATPEIIKNSFKLASFVEKVVNDLNSKGVTNEFLEVFKSWQEQNENRNMMYQMDTFQYASDYMLDILLCNRAATIESADIALRIYTSFYPVERLHKFLKNKILQQSSCNALLQVVIDSSNDCKEIEARMMLKEWERLINEGNIQCVKQSIQEMFTNYRLSKSLHTILKMLSVVPEIDSKFKDIKSFIMEKLQEKLLDQNKEFWNCIFKEVDIVILSEACLHNRIIIDLLFKFIEYIGSMMNPIYVNSEKMWIANKQFSLCPDITYDDLFKIIKTLHGLNSEIRDLITNKIKDAGSNSSSKIWDDILFSL